MAYETISIWLYSSAAMLAITQVVVRPPAAPRNGGVGRGDDVERKHPTPFFFHGSDLTAGYGVSTSYAPTGSAVSAAPHRLQNWAPTGLSWPHCAHRDGAASAVPQAEQ